MKVTVNKSAILNGAKRIPQFLRRRYGGILLLIFLISIAVWGFVFWRYGYETAFRKPVVESRTVQVKTGELKRIIKNIEAREKSRGAILEKTFSNPFRSADSE